MDERTFIAAVAMQGILIGSFGERPNAKPTPEKVALQAVAYANALREVIKNTKDPGVSEVAVEPCPTPKV